MERVLLTGAGGFVGSHVLRHLLTETDWQVTATDSFRHMGKTDRIRQAIDGLCYETARLRVVTHDLAAPFTTQFTHLAGGSPHYIIAMASQSHVDRSIKDPVPFVRNNVDVMLNTLEYARQCPTIRAVIVISTDEVYGPVDFFSPGHPEWAPILPSNPYSASKAAQEAIAISYWRTYGVPVVLTNTMNMIGEMQDPEKFLPSLIANIDAGREVTIHGQPRNVGTRHYLHARNLADAIVFILRNLPPASFPANRALLALAPTSQAALAANVSDRPDRYNIAGLERIDNLDLAKRVAHLIGKPLHFRFEDFHSTRPGHDPHYGLDSAKITFAGWKAPVPFDQSLAKTVQWTLAHREWLLP